LVLLLPLAGFVIIRSENEIIKFYNLQKIASYFFIVILVSSSIMGPFSYSVVLWGNAFAQEADPLGDGIGPPDELSLDLPIIKAIENIIEEITDEQPPAVEELPPEEPVTQEPITNVTTTEPIANVTNAEPVTNVTTTKPIVNNTTNEPIVEQPDTDPTGDTHTTVFDENLVLSEDTTIIPEYNEIIPDEPIIPQTNNQTISFNETFILHDNSTVAFNNKTVVEIIPNNLIIKLNEILILNGSVESSGIPLNYSQTNLIDGFTFVEDIIILLNNQTVQKIIPPEPKEESSKLFSNGFISDLLRINYTDADALPNATESWQFGNDTDNVDLIGDAEIDYTEGINGTSLVLDGDQDFAQTNSTNSTTYITEMSIAAWVKPNYTKGSPEFTVVSKAKSFALTINNIIEPQHFAKFAIFDGIKWTTVESTSSIPDDSWTHLTARFNKTSIEIYVNGTLQGTANHEGVHYVSENGQIELKTLQEITSYYDIVIGAELSPNMESSAFNMFSGMIDGVQLFDSKLDPEDVMNLYLDTIPIKIPEPEPEPRGIPNASLRYRIIKGNETKLPVSIPVEDLNDDITELTVSTWINPNYTGGSPEFTVIGKESSFVLSLNKMLTPEQVAKFSVYDGIMWHTVTGNATIDGWTHVAAVINGSNVSLYVNGTLDGHLDTGPPIVQGSTTDVSIGAYQNTLRGEERQSNYYFGEIDEVVVWKYSMVDYEIQEEFGRVIEVYLNQTNSIERNTFTISLNETLSLLETEGIPNNNQENLSSFLQFTDGILVKLNDTWINNSLEYLGFTDQISLLFNNQTISYNEPENKTVSFVENLTIQDTIQTFLPNDSTIFSEGLQFTDDILLKLNDTFILVLPD